MGVTVVVAKEPVVMWPYTSWDPLGWTLGLLATLLGGSWVPLGSPWATLAAFWAGPGSGGIRVGRLWEKYRFAYTKPPFGTLNRIYRS